MVAGGSGQVQVLWHVHVDFMCVCVSVCAFDPALQALFFPILQCVTSQIRPCALRADQVHLLAKGLMKLPLCSLCVCLCARVCQGSSLASTALHSYAQLVESRVYFSISPRLSLCRFTICHKTEVVKNTLNPVWQAFKIPVRALCNGDYDR